METIYDHKPDKVMIRKKTFKGKIYCVFKY